MPASGGGEASPARSAAAADPMAEQDEYAEAFEHVKQRRYARAAQALESFVERHPQGAFTDNAQYWLGESYYALGRLDQAMSAFEALRSRFPDSQKLPHAMLKMGYIHDEKGQAEQARSILEALVATYPGTTAAVLASQRLERIR